VDSQLPRIDSAAIRYAATADIESLVSIEERCFSTDKVTSRQFRYILTKARAATIVFQHSSLVVGYAVLFFNARTSLARLYSIAVLPDMRGSGIARKLATTCESIAKAKGISRMRLEIHIENTPSIALFRSMGYRPIRHLKSYYEDGADGWRYEKNLSAEAILRN
jgi:ribosomal protein S18 acetylase RimI-like enzyme